MRRLPATYWRLPSGWATPATTAATDVFATLKQQVQQCAYWRLVETPNTGSTCLLLQPIPGATNVTCSNMNVVWTNNVTGSSAYISPDDNTAAQYRLMVGMTPDVTGFTGSLGSGSFKGPNADRPFQSATGDPRWAGYMHMAVTASISASCVLESPEAIAVFFKDRSSSSGTYGAIAGCIVETPSVGSGEANGRLFGVVSTGATLMSTTFWGSTTAFFSQAITTGQPHTGVYVVSGGVPAGNQWQPMARLTTTVGSAQGGIFDVISGSSAQPAETVWPVPFFCSSTPQRYLGHARGMFMGKPSLGLVRVQRGASGTQDLGFRVSSATPTNTTLADALHFYPASGSGL